MSRTLYRRTDACMVPPSLASAPSLVGLPERQPMGHLGELEDPLHDPRPGLDLEHEAVLRRFLGPPRHEVKPRGVHEREPAQVEDELLEPRPAEMPELM